MPLSARDPIAARSYPAHRMTHSSAADRVAWVDIAKGISMALVVLAHCLNVTPDQRYYVGWLDGFNDILRLVRML